MKFKGLKLIKHYMRTSTGSIRNFRTYIASNDDSFIPTFSGHSSIMIDCNLEVQCYSIECSPKSININCLKGQFVLAIPLFIYFRKIKKVLFIHFNFNFNLKFLFCVNYNLIFFKKINNGTKASPI